MARNAHVGRSPRSATISLPLEVCNILDGRTRDGRPAERRFAFTADPAARGMAVKVCHEMLDELFRQAPHLHADAVTREKLMRKFFVHLVRSRRQNALRILAFAEHACRAVFVLTPDTPHSTAPGRYASALRRVQPAVRPPMLPLPPGTPPRREVWRAAGGAYHLEELTHPFHLLVEAHALRHCIASHDIDGRHHARPSFAGADRLVYWRRIAASRSRIFSFGDREGPLVTMEFERAERAIIDISPRKGTTVCRHHHYFDDLVMAIVHLSRRLKPMGFCYGLFHGDDLVAALEGRVLIAAPPEWMC